MIDTEGQRLRRLHQCLKTQEPLNQKLQLCLHACVLKERHST